MVTVISRFRVRNGLQAQVHQAFLERPRLVENAPGFRGLNVFTDSADPAVFLLLTNWTDEPSFRAWHSSADHRHSHAHIPKGLKLDASFTSVTVAHAIENPAGPQTLSDAVDTHSHALANWLSESETVYALLLAPDGSIRARNRASQRIFAADPANNSASRIWDYLLCSDGDQLRQRLANSTPQEDPTAMLLNLSDVQRNPVTLEVTLIPCGPATILVGTHEHTHAASFQLEVVKLSNDLSVMMRESAQKNRDLLEANATIQRLARTDALTGLANRRTFDETLPQEIARAARQEKILSIIIADLEHFKCINDDFGHRVGDQVLSQAAAIFAVKMRPYDLAARYGGEEFIFVLPGTLPEDAVNIAERIRKEIEKLSVAACTRPITMSFGVAAWFTEESPAQFIQRADAALYRAKSRGRNRVESAEALPAPSAPSPESSESPVLRPRQ